MLNDFYGIDKYIYLFYITIAVIQIFTYKFYYFTMYSSFLMATYAVITNDSIQTIGTFIASTKQTPWYYIAIFLAVSSAATTILSFYLYDGDITYERLSKKGFNEDPVEYSYIQAVSPLILLLLTRLRMPVSTSLLLIGIFTTDSKAFVEVVQKSAQSYGIAFGVSILTYGALYRGPIKEFLTCEEKPVWAYVVQYVCTTYLWCLWLMWELCVFGVYLRRQLEVWELAMTVAWLVVLMAVVAYNRGERVQTVVEKKTNTKNMREASLMDLLYGTILFVFKQRIKIPMSTTWIFLGFLAGREFGIAITDFTCARLTSALKMTGWDALMAFLGFVVSIIALLIQNPNYFEEFI
eukprot:Mrub_05039.p2 GENE.Mrub_05039~~Mrub_05039.p2  ORF type:complete len:376 (-),score=78.73 Mrub_05039:53-1105(-)